MRKAFLIFFAFLLSFFVAIYIFKDGIAKWFLERQLQKVERLSQGLSYGDLHVAFSGKQVQFTDIKYQSLNKAMSFEAAELTFKGLSLYDLFQSNGLHVDSVFLSHPNFYLDQSAHPQDSSKTETGDIEVNVDYFSIIHGNLKIRTDSVSSVEVKQYGLSVQNISTSANNIDFPVKYGAFQGTTDTIIYENSKNKVKISELSLNHENQIAIASLELHNENKNIRRSSKMRTFVDEISMDVLMDSLIQNQVIISDLLRVDSFYVYSEIQQFPVSNTAVRPKMPVELIRSISPLKLIKKLSFKNGTVEYDEHQAEGGQTISVFFNNIAGSIDGFGQASDTNQSAKLDAELDFMNVCHLKTNIDIDLTSDYEKHHIKGEVKPFELEKLNVVLKQIAPFEFEGGAVSNFTFNFSLNDDQSEGLVNLTYEDLTVSSYKKQDETEREKLAIFLVNSFVIRKDNLVNEAPVKGEVNFERVKEKSMFNYWWKSLFTGFKDVILKK